MRKEVVPIKVSELEIHPLVKEIWQKKKVEFIKYTMKLTGQENPIYVVKRKDKFYVVEGVVRLVAAQEIPMEYLDCIVLDIPDNQVIDQRLRLNQKSKTHIKETCYYVEHMLGLIGKSQGKKHELMGFAKFNDEEEFGLAGKERYEIACHYTGLDFGSSTLRKLMKIYWLEKEDEKVAKLELLEFIDRGELSVDKAHKHLMKRDKKIKDKEEREKRDYEGKSTKGWYKLFNKSSLDLSDLEDGSIKLAGFSPPYEGSMRSYRHQDELKHGQEKTTSEYITNGMMFCKALLPKLHKDAVVFIIIGESYKGSYNSVVSRYELALRDIGFDIIGVCPWIKENPTPVKLKEFFQPADEKIIVCKKIGGKPTFHPTLKQSEGGSGEIKLKRSRDGKNGKSNYYMGGDSTCITNVITTPVFNHNEYKDIDPSYKHDAPSPKKLYEIFIETYSNPSDTFLDIFCGSGQGLDVALSNGRNAIGYDIDPLSIEFCEKRLNKILNNPDSNEVGVAA
jgi:DNA modification methylase